MFSWFKKKEVTKPRYCCWVLTYRCMFRCRMCHIWKTSDAGQGETSMEEKKRFVLSLKKLVDPGFEIHLSGGEPLMMPGIFELIRFIADQGYKTNLVTNGFLVNEAVAQKLADSGLGMLTFSVDGAQDITHDGLRGMAGSYEKIMQAVTLVDQKSKGAIRIAFLTTIMESNLDEIEALVARVENDSRISLISFQAITQPFGEEGDGVWFEKERNRALWPQDPVKAAALMQRLCELKIKGFKIGNHQDHFLQFAAYFQNPNKFLRREKCTLGDYEFHVDPYGKVFFCCLMNPIGNIRTGSLPQLWQAAQTNSIRKAVYACRKNCHIMVNCFFETEGAP